MSVAIPAGVAQVDFFFFVTVREGRLGRTMYSWKPMETEECYDTQISIEILFHTHTCSLYEGGASSARSKPLWTDGFGFETNLLREAQDNEVAIATHRYQLVDRF